MRTLLLCAIKPFRLGLPEEPAYDVEVDADDAKSPGYDQKFNYPCHDSPFFRCEYDFGKVDCSVVGDAAIGPRLT